MRSRMVFNYGTELSDALIQGGTMGYFSFVLNVNDCVKAVSNPNEGWGAPTRRHDLSQQHVCIGDAIECKIALIKRLL